MPLSSRRHAAFLSVVLLTAVAAAAPPLPPPPASGTQGATTQPTKAATSSAARARGLLAGPRVEPEAIGRPSEGTARAEARRPDAIPPRRWFALVREIDLTFAQRREVRKIVAKLQRERKAFDSEHGDDFRRLGRQMREARDSETPPFEADRATFETLRAKQPKIERHQLAIWKLLTPAQQEQLRAEIARVRKEIRAQRKKRSRAEQ